MIVMRWICCVLWILLISHGSGIAEEAEAFRFSRPIDVEEPTHEELFAVPLDSLVYSETRDGFPDLRLLDAEHRQVPFLIRRVSEARTEKVRKTWTVTSPALKPLDDQGLEIRIVLKPEDSPPQGLSFVTPLQNFEQQVRIFSTVDGTESALVDEALIFDYSRFMDVRRTEVSLPPTNAREFRIVIDALTADQESQLLELTRSLRGEAEDGRTETSTIQRRPFRIDRINLWTEHSETKQRSDVVQSWPVTDLKVIQDSEHQQTLAEFTSGREPLTQLQIVTTDRNFSRHAALQIETEDIGQSGWKTIAESTLSQFQLRSIEEQHLTLSLPETRRNHYRLVLDNRDSPELSIGAIEALGPQYEVVFLGKPGQSLHLVYGSETAEPPAHDTASLTMALSKDIRPESGELGVQSVMTDSTAGKQLSARKLLNNPLALGAVVGLLVIALGWGLYQASRRIEQMPGGDTE